MLLRFLSVILALSLPVFITCAEPECDVNQLREICLNTPGAICTFVANEENPCACGCHCVDDHHDCNVHKLKKDCINDKTQSCTFTLYNTDRCITGCDCAPKTNEPYIKFCDVERAEKDCMRTPDAICQFDVLNAQKCEHDCSCVSANPPFVCDIEGWKDSCINDETQSCTFTLYNTESCNATCDCRPKLVEPYTKFCNIEEDRNKCLNTPEAICQFEILNAETCETGCACVSADPPYICDIEGWKNSCINDETQSCTFTLFNTDKCNATCDCQPKTDEPYNNFCNVEESQNNCKKRNKNCNSVMIDASNCLIGCRCISDEVVTTSTEAPEDTGFSCDFYLREDKQACVTQSFGKNQCDYIINYEYCIGECNCHNDDVVTTSTEAPEDTGFSCDYYLRDDKQACEAQSFGKKQCDYIINYEYCIGECDCHKRRRCYPVTSVPE